jgi:hypothetical protein
VPSPHGTVFAGQGAAMRTEMAAADAARGMRQRIDANRTLHCGVFVANNAIYSRSVRLNPRKLAGRAPPLDKPN